MTPQMITVHTLLLLALSPWVVGCLSAVGRGLSCSVTRFQTRPKHCDPHISLDILSVHLAAAVLPTHLTQQRLPSILAQSFVLHHAAPPPQTNVQPCGRGYRGLRIQPPVAN